MIAMLDDRFGAAARKSSRRTKSGAGAPHVTHRCDMVVTAVVAAAACSRARRAAQPLDLISIDDPPRVARRAPP